MPVSDKENSITRITFEPRGTMRKAWDMRDKELILSGPAGTGKTRFLLERQHLVLSKYPKARGLMLRKFRSSMTETCMQVFRDEVLKPEDGVRWAARDQKWVYPNGAEWIVAGLDDPQKVMSSMYDFAYANEAIELRLGEWEAVMTRLRNYKVPYQQMLGDTNPGPPTHWIKQRSQNGPLKLVETTHRDNPRYWDSKKRKWTKEGVDYVLGTLSQITGIRRLRLFEGKWAQAEGIVYPEFQTDIHVVKRFEPPKNWRHYWVFDFGYVDPFVWGHWVEDPDTGFLYLYQEIYQTELRVEDACNIILDRTRGMPSPAAVICDHDSENRATLEKHLGVLTLAAHKGIADGIEAVKRRLTPSPIHKVPMLYYMENTVIKPDPRLKERYKPLRTVDEYDMYVWDTAKMHLDRYKDLPVDRDNHGMDMTRYMVAFADDLAIDPQEWEDLDFLDDDEMVKISLY